MSAKLISDLYEKNKIAFHSYINGIKRSVKPDFYLITNPTLNKNPFVSGFPLNYFMEGVGSSKNESLFFLFLKSITKFYAKNLYFFCSYIVAYLLYKAFYKKSSNTIGSTIIDTYTVVDKINAKGHFSEGYVSGLYESFDKAGKPCVILPRICSAGKNPFRLIEFFKILNASEKEFILEYQFLSFKDFFDLLCLIALYPFKTLRLIQSKNDLHDSLFNMALMKDITKLDFMVFTRYILGKNLSRINEIKNIYSWSEFQSIERSFNYAIRKRNKNIIITALQFYLNYETYFSSYVDELDCDHKTSPHHVLVNGSYYLRELIGVNYSVGVSLRYGDLFKFGGVSSDDHVVFLGSYQTYDTQSLLDIAKSFDNAIFKNHPAIDINKLGKVPNNITISDSNIYTLFEHASVVIGTASGTSVEAVACGIPVVVIASQSNLTANSLVDYGRGEIWQLAYNKEDVEEICNNLIAFKRNNPDRVAEISNWYKNKFFVEPTKENIIRVFSL